MPFKYTSEPPHRVAVVVYVEVDDCDDYGSAGHVATRAVHQALASVRLDPASKDIDIPAAQQGWDLKPIRVYGVGDLSVDMANNGLTVIPGSKPYELSSRYVRETGIASTEG